MEGIVKWFDPEKGYGFITGQNGGEYHAHFSDIEGHGYRTLEKDQLVEFEPGRNEYGLKAHRVRVIGILSAAPERVRGTIAKYNPKKGYGFITPDGGGPDVFAHIYDIAGRTHDSLEVGWRVEYQIAENQSGRLQAREIQVLESSHQEVSSVLPEVIQPAPERIRGTVLVYDRQVGYGYIVYGDGKLRAWVSDHALRQAGIKNLRKGDEVEFEIKPAPKAGDLPEAINPRLIQEG